MRSVVSWDLFLQEHIASTSRMARIQYNVGSKDSIQNTKSKLPRSLSLSLSLSLFSIYVSIYIHPSMHLSIFSIPLPFSSLFPMNFITSFGWQHLADIYRVLMRCTFNSEKLFLFNLWWGQILVFFFFLTLRNPANSF